MSVPLPPTNSETQEMSRARETFIGPYRIEVRIGDGGMGIVYKCYDAKLKRFVALKVLKEKLSSDPKHSERFLREGQAIASLSHPNVAQIHSIEGGDGAPPYLVMEYIEGASAETLLKAGGALPPERAIAIIRDAACGLKAAFLKGIIHRDVKPSNILITAEGAAKLVDFGLAKAIEGAGSLTEEGMVVGTPHYISPEQGRGQKVDQRSDIYSLGATFYHLVTGKPPFDADSQLAVIVAHLHKVPVPPHRVRPGVSEGLSMVVGKMLAKDPERRYANYQELIDDLERLARGEAIGARTAADGAETFLPERTRVPARYWWMAGAAVALSVAVTLAAVVHLFPATSSEAQQLRRLGSWYIPQDPSTECLDLNFASLPEGASRAEVVRLLFLTGKAEEHEIGIGLPGPSLQIKDLAGPAALRFPFERLDEVRIQGLRIEGRADFGVALVHPDGMRLRSLHFSLRCYPPHETAGRGEDLRTVPLVARRSGEAVPFGSGAPPAPRLGTGPYDLVIILRPEGESTRVEIIVSRSGGASEAVYSTEPGKGPLLAGRDWQKGVLLLYAQSPLRRATVAIGRMVLVGLIDHRRPLEALTQDS
jgi:tRNA A-37 threonylcarbamoyl transferase component Bud32